MSHAQRIEVTVGDTIRLHTGETATVAAVSSWGVRCGGVWFNPAHCTLVKAARPVQGALDLDSASLNTGSEQRY